MSEIISIIKNHMGVGFVSVLFVMSLVYLLFAEKDKVKRCLFVHVPLILLAAFLCPISLKIYAKVSGSITYYRLLWLIPVTPVIAYAAVRVVSEIKGFKQNLCIAGLALLFAVSGRLIYTDIYMVDAVNIYHMPANVVDICDALHVEGREVKALVPDEMQQFVRQYDPCIHIPYGREYMMNMFLEEDELKNEMEGERRPYEVGILATQRGCHYIVVPWYQRFDTLPEYYEEYTVIDGYIIYKNVLLSTEVGKLQNDDL